MNEPYVKASIVDQTSGITSVTSASGLQIGCPINSLTGPTERVTLNSLGDLVKYFMPGTAFSSNDDITIQHIGALLNSNPVDVIRVDNSTMREGIGSIGSKIYFDTNYNLINEYTNLNIGAASSNKRPAVVYVILSINSNNVTCYSGNSSYIPSEYTQTGIKLIDMSSGSYDVTSGTVDIDAFFSNFQKFMSMEDEPYNTSGLIDNSANDAVFNVKVENVGGKVYNGTSTEDALFNVSINQFNNQLWMGTLPQRLGQTLSSGTTIQIGESTLFFNTGTENVASEVNPIPVPTSPVSGYLPACVWYGLAIDKIQNTPDIQSLTGYSSVTSMTVTNGIFGLSNNLSKYISVSESGDGTGLNRLTFNGSLETVKGYHITLNYNDTKTYYFHDSLDSSAVPSGAIDIILSANTIPGIFGEMYIEMMKVQVLQTNTSLATLTDAFMYYLDDINPSVVVNLKSGASDLNFTESYSDGSSVHHLTSAENTNAWEYNGLYIIIDGNCFYVGSQQPSGVEAQTFIKLDNGPCTIEEFLDLLYSNIGSVFNVYGRTSTGFVIDGDYSSSISVSSSLSVNTRLVDQTTYRDKFAVIAAFPATSRLFQYSYSNGEEEGQYELSLSYKGEVSEYTISFDPEAVDGYGNNLYYDAVINSNGEINVFFRMLELEGTDVQDSYKSPTFGNSIMRVTPQVNDYIDALNKFADYDNKYYDYFWDAGVSSPLLVAAGTKLATDVNAEFVGSFPVTYKKESQFAEYRENTGVNNPRLYMIQPAQKQAALGNFNSTLSHSITFLRAKISLYNSVANEFAPAFGPNYGRVAIGTQTATLSKAARERLLDHQINSVVVGTSGPMINFNLTCQKTHSYLDEEQFVYLSNVICHVADSYGDNLIGYENTAPTRSRVVTELTELLNQRIIANKNQTVTAFRVVCDENLNTTQIIESRKIKYQVWVQYTPTTAYVEAYTVIKRLGSF